MATEHITKQDLITYGRITKMYSVPNFNSTIYLDVFNSEYDGYYFNLIKRGILNYHWPEVKIRYHNHNIDQLKSVIKSKFFCDIYQENHSQGFYAIYFIELRITARIEFKVDRVFINAEFLCTKIRLVEYMKRYYDKISFVGYNLLIQVII